MSQIIDQLYKIISNDKDKIDNWFESKYKKTPPFFYSSVDLRHSGYKIAPVDTNLFPAGFNLLSENAKEAATKRIREYIKKNIPQTKNILLIPESHTRNTHYLENILTLKQLIEKAEINVKLGGIDIKEKLILESASKNQLTIEPIKSSDKKIFLEDKTFIPDTILVNNDLSTGAPEILKDIEQQVIPPVGMGWYQRRKTRHFDTYLDVVNEFSKEFEIDKWLISTVFHKCGTINFKEKTGLECVSDGVERVLEKVQKKYNQYNIKDKPYVFIKADSGTYGMGIMTVSSGKELMDINKKTRNKMNIIKEGVQNSEVIIQEGVPTIDKIGGKVAEPMVYLINGEPIGCTYRINQNRDEYSNLNSSGMTFDNACSTDAEINEVDRNKDMCPVRGLIGKLASLAATYECYEPYWSI